LGQFLTRRAHNVDQVATQASFFLDRRSYVTHSGHAYLFGNDVTMRRHEVYERDLGKCQDCGKRALWDEGEMNHIQGGLVGRCTCMHNLEWLCKPCHRARHVSVKWSKP